MWESHVCTYKYVAYCMHFKLQTILGNGLAHALSHPVCNCEPQIFLFQVPESEWRCKSYKSSQWGSFYSSNDPIDPSNLLHYVM